MKPQVSEHGLDGVEIFRDLEEDERARLAAELETLNLRRGEVLVRQGEMAEALYIVVTGRFCGHRRRPARGGRRAGSGPAGRRDRLPRRRCAHRHRHGAARQPGAAAGAGRVRGAVGQEPVDLAHADRDAGAARGRRPTSAASRRPTRAPHHHAHPCRLERAAAGLHRRPDAGVPAQQPHRSWCGRRWPRRCCPRRSASTAPRRRGRSMRSRPNTTMCCSSPSRS